jgi:pantoate--beta-alanine ligase
MIVFKKGDELHNFLIKRKINGFKTGFVPSMGALHKGHLSLIEASKKQNDITTCSIFVNPTQFNDPKDFEKYPVTLENDIYLLEKAGCDVAFLPSINEIYPDGNKNSTLYELGYLENILEGKYRQGHFQGVCQVMDRLLTIIQPTNLYLGQKDYQQCVVIKKLVEIMQMDTIINTNPTVRETSGLAMSSRNMRLNETEKKQAIRIYEALSLIKKELKPGNLVTLKEKAIDHLAAENFKIDYIEIVNAATLTTVEVWDGETALVALCAAFLNEVRLIDNLLLN